MEKFRWCFIGTGTLAKIVAKQLLKTNRHEIVACFSRSFNKAEAFAKKYNCIAYKDVNEAINDSRVDGVYIVTPHNAHARYAKLALIAKKPTFVEKPFTVFASESKELIDLARNNNTFLAEAMWTWYSPSANNVKKWVDDKLIGNIKQANFTYHLKSINYAPRVADPKRAGGALLDITIYPIAYSYVLFGKPNSIESKAIIKNEIDEAEEIIFNYNNGLKVNISASIIDFKGLEKMKLVGENGVVKANFYHMAKKVKLITSDKKVIKYKGKGPFINSYVDEFDSVVNDIRNGCKESSKVSLNQTYEIMKILDNIREQIGLKYENLE